MTSNNFPVGSSAYCTEVKVGQPIPDYEFAIFHEGKTRTVRFSDFKDKWVVLFFYPADFTFVCPTELAELAEVYSTCQTLGTEIISVSSDTVFTHKAWHNTSDTIAKIKFPMAADPDGRLAKAFGTYIAGAGLNHVADAGLPLRGTFIISPDGILKTSEIHDNAIGRSAKEMLRKLKAAQFVTEYGDKVCPASWDEGGETLTPGMDLVGKI
jgi:peroxiredoxin (alkyl hydroperoxide reductase subunit C)